MEYSLECIVRVWDLIEVAPTSRPSVSISHMRSNVEVHAGNHRNFIACVISEGVVGVLTYVKPR